MVVIGLTGNIATGKSTVARMLADLGAEIIDADTVAHQVMLPGTVAHQAIVKRFGDAILAADGSINRAALGSIVFSDSQALSDLESIVHPEVEAAIRARLAQSDAPVVVVEAIKLLEAGLDRYCDSVWVTTSPRETQIQRLMQTRGLSREQALQRMDAQPDPSAKLARADVVIDNSGSLDQTRAQVQQAWRSLPRENSHKPNTRTFFAQWLVLSAGMVALLPLGSRLIGWRDWREWAPLAPACVALATISLLLIHHSQKA